MLLYIVEGGRQLGHGLVEADVLENLWRKINSYIKYSYTPTTARKQTVNFPLELFLHPVFFCDKSFSSWSVLNRNHTSVNFFGSGCAHNCFLGVQPCLIAYQPSARLVRGRLEVVAVQSKLSKAHTK